MRGCFFCLSLTLETLLSFHLTSPTGGFSAWNAMEWWNTDPTAMPTATYAMPRVEHSRPSTSKNISSSDWHRDATTSNGMVLMLPMEAATVKVRRRRRGATREKTAPMPPPRRIENTRLAARGHQSRRMEASTASAT